MQNNILRSQDAFTIGKLIRSAQKTQMLTAQQEAQAITKAQGGCKKSKDQLINSNIKFVVKIAKTYNVDRSRLSVADLVSEGIIGLNTAITKFDVTKGF